MATPQFSEGTFSPVAIRRRNKLNQSKLGALRSKAEAIIVFTRVYVHSHYHAVKCAAMFGDRSRANSKGRKISASISE